MALQQQHTFLQRRAGLAESSIVGDEQLDYLRERADLSLVAYSPLLKGLYDMPAAERPGHPGMEPYAGDAAARRLAGLDAVAAETGCQPGQVVLAWMVAQRSPRVLPLIGTTKVSRYREAAQALDLELTAGQLTALDGA